MFLIMSYQVIDAFWPVRYPGPFHLRGYVKSVVDYCERSGNERLVKTLDCNATTIIKSQLSPNIVDSCVLSFLHITSYNTHAYHPNSASLYEISVYLSLVQLLGIKERSLQQEVEEILCSVWGRRWRFVRRWGECASARPGGHFRTSSQTWDMHHDTSCICQAPPIFPLSFPFSLPACSQVHPDEVDFRRLGKDRAPSQSEDESEKESQAVQANSFQKDRLSIMLRLWLEFTFVPSCLANCFHLLCIQGFYMDAMIRFWCVH